MIEEMGKKLSRCNQHIHAQKNKNKNKKRRSEKTTSKSV